MSRGARDMVKQICSARRPKEQLRLSIVVAAALWWIALALLSRLSWSALQLEWDLPASVAILAFFPLCILAGALPVLLFPLRWRAGAADSERRINGHIRVLFLIAVGLFVLQCVIQLPPALSDDPMNARLDWGFKFLHVATEIVIRAAVLAAAGTIAHRGRLSMHACLVIAVSIGYAFLVVSRGLILEFMIYFVLATVVARAHGSFRFSIRPRQVLAVLAIAGLFVAYGQWRQGADFSVAEYGEMLLDSDAAGWFFGYFLVNFDNLALLIMENYGNEAPTNVFGPLLQSLQLLPYEAVDAYLYVGKFNLGTALRPYVLDLGPWAGGVSFAVIWGASLLLPNTCTSRTNRFAIIIALAYYALVFPVTNRLEVLAYFGPLLLLVLGDRMRGRVGQRASVRGDGES